LLKLILVLAVVCRLSEQSRMSAEYKRLLSDIRDQYSDARDWNLRYKAAFKDIHLMELGTLISTMQNPLELGEWLAVGRLSDEWGVVCGCHGDR